MGKSKKNTLSDLNAFLKHKNNDQKTEEKAKKDYLKSSPHTIAEVNFLEKDPEEQENLTEQAIIKSIERIAEMRNESFSQLLRNIIIKAYENKREVNASDLMLLNTALYLDHTEQLSEGFKELVNKKQ